MSGELPIALRRALVHSPDSELRTRSPDLRPNERPIAQLSELVRDLPNSRPDLVSDVATFRSCSRPSDRVRDRRTRVRDRSLLMFASQDPTPHVSDNYGNVYTSLLSFIVQYLVYSCALGKGDP